MLIQTWLCAVLPALLLLADGPGTPGGQRPRGTAAGPEGLPAPLGLHFVMNSPALTADLGVTQDLPSSVLGKLFDTNVACVLPGAGSSAVKVHSTPEVNCITGDLDQDGDCFEVHFGDVDALGFRRLGVAPAPPSTARYVFSAQDAFGDADEGIPADFAGATDGSLFRLLRATDGDGPRVELFLSETLVLEAIAQADDPTSDGLDVDAFCQDVHGNVFLSFRHEEDVHGELLGPGGVVCLPAAGLSYDALFNVDHAVPGSACIVLHQAAVDALVAQAGLRRPSGWSITTAGNLQALEIDPEGGVFTPVEPVPGYGDVAPHLLFNSEKVGPTILTTRGGGAIARVNGAALGHQVIQGGALGLDPDSTARPTADLNGLALAPWAVPQICIDASQAELDLHGPSPAPLEFLAGPLPPFGPAWWFLAVQIPTPGCGWPSLPAPAGMAYPDLFVPQPAYVQPSQADGFGRALLRILPDPAPPFDIWVLAQVWDPKRHRLSAPGAIWCPGP